MLLHLPTSAQIFPKEEWLVEPPSELGLDAEKLEAFAAAIGGDGVIVRHGRIAKTWGDPAARGDWASAVKPLASTLLFFAIEEGKIPGVDALVSPWAKSVLGLELSEKDRTMTWRHLANMTSGYTRAEKPGEAWAYNDYAIKLYMRLLFEGVFGLENGKGIDSVANAPNRLGALQAQDGGYFGSRGGFGLNASPRDAARLGLFWMRRGQWNGKQILPRDFFDRYLRSDVPETLPRTASMDTSGDYLDAGTIGGDSDQSEFGPGVYGFNWWFNNTAQPYSDPLMASLPPDAFKADGHFGKEVILVVPSLDLVVAARGNWGGLEGSKSSLLMDAVLDAPERPLPEQIVRDPIYPQWLKRANGKSVFIVGPGDPEGFLYRGDRLADGTRKGDQMELIEKLKRYGGNCIYLQTIRSHGGDGLPDHNPFIESDPSLGIDSDILEQWETWFSAMDDAGILIYLFVYDDGAQIWGGNEVSPEEEAYLRELVSRFQHHRNLIWIVGEEALEAYSKDRVRSIAACIARYDHHDHVIGSHGHSNTDFNDWEEASALNHYSMQYNVKLAEAVHEGAKEARLKAENAGESGDGYFVIYSENTERRNNTIEDLDNLRSHIWEVSMAGVMPMNLNMDIANTPPELLEACRILQQFFESTDFASMRNLDAMAIGETDYVLGNLGQSYIAYGRNVSKGLRLKGLAGGIYDLHWLDVVSGRTVDENETEAEVGDFLFRRPSGIGPHCALWARMRLPTSEGGTISLASEQLMVAEESEVVTFKVYRLGDFSEAASVVLTTADRTALDGEDFHGISSTLSWQAGDREAKTVEIPLVKDAKPEGEEHFAVSLSDLVGAQIGPVPTATIQIAASNQPNIAPRARSQKIRMKAGSSATIALIYNDADDGPGPYRFEIENRPVHGSLVGKGNDFVYTPEQGFTGEDSFTWRVSDGEADSAPGKVTILVLESGL